MGTRVVLDANVLVSALGWRGASYQILQLCVTRKLELLSSPALLSELERVLSYPKLGFTAERIAAYLELLMELATVVQPSVQLAVVEADESDNRVLECAVAGGATAIVSGDTHLLELKQIQDIPVLSPRAFLELFLSIEGSSGGSG